MHYTIHTDGGARGNPGPAGAGAVIECEDKTIQLKKYLSKKTNNQAEYEALILALSHIINDLQDDGRTITAFCYLDSELVVNQLNGDYKVKNEGIKPLYAQVCDLSSKFHEIHFKHIPRSENQAADLLVNQAIDENIK